MSEMTSYAAGDAVLGRPRVADLDASVAFYGGLFGWEVPEAENAEPRRAATAAPNWAATPSPG